MMQKKKINFSYPDGEFMWFGQGVAVVRVDDVILPDGHGVAFDVFGDAFSVGRLYLETEWLRSRG